METENKTKQLNEYIDNQIQSLESIKTVFIGDLTYNREKANQFNIWVDL